MILLAFLPFSDEVDSIVTVAIVAAILWALIGFEVVRFAEARAHIRQQLLHGRTRF